MTAETLDGMVECVACEWHYPPELGVAVLWDVMGDPRPSVEVCPNCAEHAERVTP